MKNIRVISTNNPSRICKYKDEFYFVKDGIFNLDKEKYNIYITSDEQGFKDDWVIHTPTDKILKVIERVRKTDFRKIILTTDQDLIEEGVQAIDDEFLEWFVKNPNCKEVKIEKGHYEMTSKVNYHTGNYDFKCSNCNNEEYNLWYSKKPTLCFKCCQYKIIIPEEETFKHKLRVIPKEEIMSNRSSAYEFIDFNKEETLEEVAERIFKIYSNNTSLAEGHYDYMMDKEDFKEASSEIIKWQLNQILDSDFDDWLDYRINTLNKISFKEWFEQFKNK